MTSIYPKLSSFCESLKSPENFCKASAVSLVGGAFLTTVVAVALKFFKAGLSVKVAALSLPLVITAIGAIGTSIIVALAIIELVDIIKTEQRIHSRPF